MKTYRNLRHKTSISILVLLILLSFAACDAADQDEAAQVDPTVTAPAIEEPTAQEVDATPIPTAVLEGNADDSAAAPPVAADTEVIAALEGTLERIYEEVNPSVVHIQVLVEATDQGQQIPGFRPPQQGPQGGEGSGFVWDQQGHIVTNNHVIAGATTINVIFSDDRVAPATVVGADADSDLAVLRVDVPAEQLRPVQLADSTGVRVGELAIAIGNPFGQEGSLTVGVISALGRLLPIQAATFGAPSYSIPDVIQTDASINPGNSGGVLLDDQGRVIGVTTAIISPARASSGVGFAVPSRIVANVVPALIETGEYQHPYLGIQGTTLSPPVAEAMDLPATQRGALIISVEPSGPAAEAGLQGSERQATVQGFEVPVGGDVITALDGEPVGSMDDLITQLARTGQVGQSVTLTILRDGQEQEVEVTLQARPATQEPEFQEVQQAWLGILGATISPPIAEAMDLPADQTGVLIGETVGGSPAAEAGLRGSDTPAEINGQQVLVGGDVIVALDGHPVPDIQTLQGLLAQYAPDDEVTLTVLRDGEEVEVPVTLGDLPS